VNPVSSQPTESNRWCNRNIRACWHEVKDRSICIISRFARYNWCTDKQTEFTIDAKVCPCWWPKVLFVSAKFLWSMIWFTVFILQEQHTASSTICNMQYAICNMQYAICTASKYRQGTSSTPSTVFINADHRRKIFKQSETCDFYASGVESWRQSMSHDEWNAIRFTVFILRYGSSDHN
jgi:hypothetical protein